MECEYGYGAVETAATTARGQLRPARRRAARQRARLDRVDERDERGRRSGSTVYANPTQAYMVVAGLRFDTSARRREGDAGTR
jgi:hypothetical protein